MQGNGEWGKKIRPGEPERMGDYVTDKLSSNSQFDHLVVKACPDM